MSPISVKNERLRWARKLAQDRKARRREGLWVAEGLRLGEEVVRTGMTVRLWVVEQGWGSAGGRKGALRAALEIRSAPVLEVKRGYLCEISSTQHPQGVLTVIEEPVWTVERVLAGPGPVVLVDRLQDPGNLGTVARTAEAAGASGLLLGPGTADPGNPKSLRASAGSLLRLPSARAQDPVTRIREAGLRLVATVPEGGVPYDQTDLTDRFAIALGQEGSGLSAALRASADSILTIPMAGRSESLNVAATAAVVLFEAARQRRATQVSAMKAGRMRHADP